ncbi:hypothetical protein ACTG2F_19770 [Aeromonas sp. 31P]
MGWWDDMNRCRFQTLQLVNTEIAEATEGDRKGLMDDHLCHRKMAEVELADTLIRALDFAGRYRWTFTPRVIPDPLSTLGKFVHMVSGHSTMAVKHLGLTGINTLMAAEIWGKRRCVSQGIEWVDKPIEYDYLIAMCLHIAEVYHYDIEGAIREKLTYNALRADHKRENRAKEGGKAY